MPSCIKLPWPHDAPQSIWLVIVASPSSSLQEADGEGRGRAAALQAEALELYEGSSGGSAGLLGKQWTLCNAALLWQVPSLTRGADAPTQKHPLEV